MDIAGLLSSFHGTSAVKIETDCLLVSPVLLIITGRTSLVHSFQLAGLLANRLRQKLVLPIVKFHNDPTDLLAREPKWLKLILR
jgi:hypothetical protein